ncbi:hypothetical protein AVEN_243014-1 [Araneus ventricosus]|uniref:DNA-directed DNA polymerase n=1 Tax=Araneus ventricosus TaxID=182803 RepID=A0A4Y2D367_ARAVE|nr:hypothetical protein AVEN_243014-1 [Araneus ventricosus]
MQIDWKKYLNDACNYFCAWLFSPTHKGFTAIAHNMKGFDGQFIMAWMLQQGTTPAVISNRSKVMSITHTTLHIRVIDSFNFLSMSLSKIPGCFELSELKKGYFPHLFNSKENQSYVGSYPDPKYFNPDAISGAARAPFLE